MTNHVVYRMFDNDGELLYVGMTKDLPQWIAHHRATKEWWPDVADIMTERYDSREAAHAAEQQAIDDEHQPEHHHRPDPHRSAERRGEAGREHRCDQPR